jgi:hypothetical protein
MENRIKVVAVALPICAWGALAFAAIAHSSNARSNDASGSASTSAQTYCDELRQGISAQGYRFFGWRCKQGPNIRGQQTILVWVKLVKLTRMSGRADIKLIWLTETQPVLDAPVIDIITAPHYGYEPSNVTKAFRTSVAEHPSAFTA